MTKIEKDELELYRIAERDGAGQSAHADFGYLSSNLAEAPVLAQLLDLHGKYLVVRVNDGQTGFRDFSTFKEGKVCLYNGGGALKLQVDHTRPTTV